MPKTERKVMDRAAVFKELKRRGIAKANVHFSGGGDEGGCDNIELLNEAGEIVCELEEYYANTLIIDGPGKTREIDPPDNDEELSEGLCVPMYERFGGFDGSSVQGTITWDVAGEKITLEGSEEVWESFDDEEL